MSEPTPPLPSVILAQPGSPFPKLRARRCACGHVTCPPHTFGCERCGRSGSESDEVELDPRGVLTALATVRVHTKLPTPYNLGRVALDDGPVLDVRLDDDARIVRGSRVRARLFTRSDASGAQSIDCRFALEEQAP